MEVICLPLKKGLKYCKFICYFIENDMSKLQAELTVKTKAYDSFNKEDLKQIFPSIPDTELLNKFGVKLHSMLTAEQSILNYKSDLAKEKILDPRKFLYVIACPVCNSKNTLNSEVRELIKCFNCNELTKTENLYKTLETLNL